MCTSQIPEKPGGRKSHRICLLIFLFGAAGLHAQELDRPIRPVHLSGNWGTNPEAVRLWEEDRTRALVPLKFVEYLRGVHVDWVGLSVGLHIEGSMDSTVERSYSPDLDVPTFTDDALRQIMREFRAHGFDVYLTLAIESFQNLTDTAAEHPMKRMQLGDPGDAEAGVPLDHVYCPECAWPIRPEFWPWRPSHPGHERFVAEFWESYTQQAVHFARMAQEEGVRMYSLGTETDRLFRTRSDGHYWVNDFRRELRTLVERVRAVYSGLLTYDMGNKAFTDEFFEAGSRQLWADLDLDVIGASAWFPLTDSRPSEVLSVESLRREYDRLFRDHLIPVAALNPGLPMVFLEYATTDTVESPANPAAYPENGMVVFSDTNGNGLDDGQEVQDNMYRALFETMEAHPGLVYGAFFWDTWIIASEGAWTGPLMYRTYSFRGKLSEETVREWYDRFGSTLWRLPENLYVSRSGTVAIAIPFAGPVHASSSAPHVATVSVSGSRVTVTPVSEGGAVITVTLAGRTQRFMVRVLPVEPAHSIRPGASVKAVHFLALRTRVEALRAQSGLPPAQWTDLVLTIGATPVKQVHMIELRVALGDVYDAVGEQRPAYTDDTIIAGATFIKAAHVEELQSAILALEE